MQPSKMRRAIVIVLTLLVAAGTGLYLFGASRLTYSTPEEFVQKRSEVFQRHGIRAESGFVTLAEPAIETHFLEVGSGPPVVVIHGGGGDGSGWVSILELLSQEFRLLVPDRPGHGLTQSFDYSGVEFRRHAAAFVASFLDSQDLDRVSLIGNSMGGFFSLVFALEHPERVEKLVLIGAPAGIDVEVPLPMRMMAVPGVNNWLMTVMSGFRGDEPPPLPPFLARRSPDDPGLQSHLLHPRRARSSDGTDPLHLGRPGRVRTAAKW
jgi:pimeloyl-ACP methyl ester carboxylesterase